MVDGVSWRILQQDFSAALALLDAEQERGGQANTPASRPEQQDLSALLPSSLLSAEGSFAAWAARLEHYAHSKAMQTELPYWQEAIRTLPPPLPTHGTPPRRVQKDLISLSVTLEPEAARPLLSRCHAAFGIESDAALLAGLADAARRWRGCESLTVLLEGHGRQELFPEMTMAATVGWFTTVHPVALRSKDSLPETLLSVRQSLASVPGKGIGYGILRHLAGGKDIAFPHADVLFNFLGDATSGKDASLLDILRLGSPHDVANDFPQEAVLALTAYTRNGALHVTLNWHPQEVHEEEASGFMDLLLESLRSITALCVAHA